MFINIKHGRYIATILLAHHTPLPRIDSCSVTRVTDERHQTPDSTQAALGMALEEESLLGSKRPPTQRSARASSS